MAKGYMKQADLLDDLLQSVDANPYYDEKGKPLQLNHAFQAFMQESQHRFQDVSDLSWPKKGECHLCGYVKEHPVHKGNPVP